MEFISNSYDDTLSFGREIGSSLKGGEVILLIGELGCGKTVLTKGIAEGIGIEEIITSPSFTILNIYDGPLCLYHFDFYRIDDKGEMEDLLEDYLYLKDGVVVIEWGEKVIELLDSYILVEIEISDPSRKIKITRKGF
ncbi:MAG: tRNA (adenosine(37)-N6)-threonylcarbamoyltransferase complex ATPase subunit type 1 TsaE [Spirochaetota bacterium]